MTFHRTVQYQIKTKSVEIIIIISTKSYNSCRHILRATNVILELLLGIVTFAPPTN
jgi:hypothetical protein